jgi:hypothetical protein
MSKKPFIDSFIENRTIKQTITGTGALGCPSAEVSRPRDCDPERMTLLRVMIAGAKIREIEDGRSVDISPVVNKTWAQCLELKTNAFVLWYNDCDNSTRVFCIAYPTAEIAEEVFYHQHGTYQQLMAHISDLTDEVKLSTSITEMLQIQAHAQSLINLGHRIEVEKVIDSTNKALYYLTGRFARLGNK